MMFRPMDVAELAAIARERGASGAVLVLIGVDAFGASDVQILGTGQKDSMAEHLAASLVSVIDTATRGWGTLISSDQVRGVVNIPVDSPNDGDAS